MNDRVAGVITFLGYRLAHFEYDCNPSFKYQDVENGELKFNFSKISNSLESGETQINLVTRVFYGNDGKIENAPLRIIVEIAGIFKEANGAPWDSKWEYNAIAIMFPYIRALIGSVTSQSGREPILLPTVNVAALFDMDGHDEE